MRRGRGDECEENTDEGVGMCGDRGGRGEEKERERDGPGEREEVKREGG